jgi:hypothetical protein
MGYNLFNRLAYAGLKFKEKMRSFLIMKLSKVLLGSLFAAAMLGLFAGCAKEDDPYNMITEKNSSTWEINHTNEDADLIHRGYKSTTFKHSGGLVNIHFDSKSTGTYGDGVMGFVFGLRDNATNSKASDFFVVGVLNRGDYYISKYTNVTNLQGNNFGVGDNDGAEEVEYVSLGAAVPSAKASTANGYDVGVYFRDVVVDSTDTTAPYAHKYQLYFVKVDSTASYDVDDDTGALKIKASGASDYSEVNLGTPIYEIDYESDSNSLSQYKFGPYANVYPSTDKCSATYKANKATGTGTLKGTWTVPADYLHADVVED